MIVVNAIIRSSEENIAASKTAIATMETASRAEAGCHDYTFSVELNDPTMMRITEQWESTEALAAHFKTPHMADFQAALAANPLASVDAKFYEVTEIKAPRPE